MNRSPQRFAGLDNWRAVLLLLGPVVHVAEPLSHRYGRILPLELVAYTSHAFRMEAFFAIAGFLAARTQLRKPEWLKKRVHTLLIPLLAVGVLIQFPMNLWLKSLWYHPYHLWFLVDLLLIAVSLYHIDRLDMLGWISKTPLLHLFLMIVVYRLINVGIYDHIPGHRFVKFWLQIASGIPYFVIFYLIGVKVAKNADFKAELCVNKALWTGLCAVSFAVFIGYFVHFFSAIISEQQSAAKYGFVVISLLFGIAATMSILSHALGVRRQNATLAWFSRGAYTVYLVHVPISSFLIHFLPRGNPFGQSVGLTMVTLTASMLIHEFGVRRSSTLQFLLNGNTSPKVANEIS